MTRQSDVLTESFVSGNAYDFISPRVSTVKNVQAVVQTVKRFSITRNELKQVIIKSIILLEYSNRLMQKSNALAESRGLKLRPNTDTTHEKSKLTQYLTIIIQ